MREILRGRSFGKLLRLDAPLARGPKLLTLRSFAVIFHVRLEDVGNIPEIELGNSEEM